MARLEIALLGSPQVLLDGRVVTQFHTAKVQGLLAYLAIEAHRPHLREYLMSLFWPDAPEPKARQSLRAALYQLRRILGDTTQQSGEVYLLVDRARVQLNHLTDYRLDVAEIATALAEDNVRLALGLYEGELLAGFSLPNCDSFEIWLRAQREALHHNLADAMQLAMHRHFEQSDYENAGFHARHLLRLEPWREGAHQLLMHIFLRAGQRSAALAQYERCRQMLQDELGVEPSAEITALYEQIRAAPDSYLRAAPDSDLLAAFPTTQSADKAVSGWVDWGDAADAVELYGRQTECAMLAQWIEDEGARLVGIVGMGGMGKTALAVATARGLANRFQVIFWCSLRNAPPLVDILRDFLDHFPEQRTVPRAHTVDNLLALAFDYLRSHRCLLVLDNLESILQDTSAGAFRTDCEDYARLFEHMVSPAHNSSLLFTSRERFRGLERLQTDSAYVQTLSLSGLPIAAAQEMVAKRGLPGTDADLAELAGAYSGSPLALKLAARTITDLFAGDVRAFLTSETLIFGDLREMLDRIFMRMSEPEQAILYRLAIASEPLLPLDLLRDPVQHWPRQTYLDAMRSLQQRVLLESSSEKGIVLHSVINEYIVDRFIDQMASEIEHGIEHDALDLCHRFALCNAQSQAYVRASQKRIILQPLAQRLLARHGKAGVEELCRRHLTQLQSRSRIPGYAAGNLLNLLTSIGADLRGGNFAALCVWQAHLEDIHLQDANFTDAELKQCVFSGAFGVIFSVALSPDESLLAAGSERGQIYLWDVATGQPLDVLYANRNTVHTLAFSHDGRYLASAGIDHVIRLWDMTSHRPIAEMVHPSKELFSIAFAPDDQSLFVSSAGGTVCVYALQTQSIIQTLRGAGDALYAVAISPDGKIVAAGGAGATLYLWHLSSPQPYRTIQENSGALMSVAFDPSGQNVAASGADGVVRIWALSTGELQHALRGHTNWIWSLSYSPDGKRLVSASADETIRFWDPEGGALQRTVKIHSGAVRSVAFGAAGHMLASGGLDQSVCLWDLHHGRVAHVLHGYFGAVTSVTCTLDGAMVAAGSANRTIRLWDRESGQLRYTLRGHTNWIGDLSFSPDGTRLASASMDRTLRIWDLQTGSCLQVLRGHTEAVWSVAFSPTGAELASSGEDGTVRLWNPNTGRLNRSLEGHATWVDAIVYHPQGQLLASAGADATVCVWDLQSSRCKARFNAHGILRAVAFSHDGTMLFAAGDAGDIFAWDMAMPTRGHTLHQSSSRLWSLATSPKANLLAASGDDPDIVLWHWNGTEYRPYQTLHGHTRLVFSLTFTPDGTTLISGSMDGTIRHWSIPDGQLLRTIPKESPYLGMNITNTSGLTAAQRTSLLVLGAIDSHQAH